MTLSELCDRMFYVTTSNNVILDYRYFRVFAGIVNYNFIVKFITGQLEIIVARYGSFSFHVNMEGLLITHIEKHYSFIQNIAVVLKDAFPEKLDVCYVYNAPFMFSALYGIVSVVIDKQTQQKIKLVV